MNTYTPLTPTWADRIADGYWAKRAELHGKACQYALAACAGLLLAALAI